MRIALTYLSVLLLLFYACSKKSGGTKTPTWEEFLIDKKWKISAASLKASNGIYSPDTYSNLPSYKKDDYFYFKSDFTFTNNDNNERAPGDSTGILDSGTWSLPDNGAWLRMISTLSPSGTPVEYFPTKISASSNTVMQWETTNPRDGAIVFTTYTVIQ